jgi:hypothetical protein
MSFPQETIDPSARSASEWLPPPATWTNPVPGGVSVTWPNPSDPQEAIDPWAISEEVRTLNRAKPTAEREIFMLGTVIGVGKEQAHAHR